MTFAACGPGPAASDRPPAEPPATPSPLVSAEEAARHLGHPDVVFVDARERLLPFAARVPGARGASWKEFVDPASGSPTGRLDPDPERLGARIAALGVRPESWVIAYGDPTAGWGEEGRFFWMMEAVGHARTSVIDGGFPAWRAAGLPVARRFAPRVDGAPPYPVAYREERIARLDEVRRAVSEGSDVALVDTRSPEEYAGATPHGERRGGYIPGATSFWFKRLLGPDGRLRAREDLLADLASAGIVPERPVIAYCTGGVRSGFAYLALRALGFERVENYDGSFWEWAAREDLPVAPGPEATSR